MYSGAVPYLFEMCAAGGTLIKKSKVLRSCTLLRKPGPFIHPLGKADAQPVDIGAKLGDLLVIAGDFRVREFFLLELDGGFEVTDLLFHFKKAFFACSGFCALFFCPVIFGGGLPAASSSFRAGGALRGLGRGLCGAGGAALGEVILVIAAIGNESVGVHLDDPAWHPA